MIITRESTNENDRRFRADKCKRPRMTRGCWDYWAEVKLNDESVRLMFESGYGFAFYFRWNGQWYRLPWYVQRADNLIPETVGDGQIWKTAENHG